MNPMTQLMAPNPEMPDNRRPAATMVVPAWVRGVPSRRLMLILRSPGCTYDRKPGGGCSFCGPRHLTTEGAKVTTDEYITQMEAALAAHEADLPQIRRVAQTSVCDVCAMLMPLEAEVESLHASAAAFLRPQPSSLQTVGGMS